MRAALLALLLAAPALAGCIQGNATPAVADEAPTAQALIEGSLAERMPIAMADGTIIDAYVFRPETDAQVPVIINFSPYWGNAAPHTETGGDAFSLYLIDYFVPRGYAVALVSARGTGLSEGCFTIGGPLELADEDAVAIFFGEAEWSNGAVTATGKSYDGTMAQGLLTMGNPYLKTIVPVAPISELYKYNYFAGVPYAVTGQAFNTYYVAQTSVAQQQDPNDPAWEKTPTRFCDESAAVQTNQMHSLLLGDYTPYWQARNYTALLPDAIDASVFYIHGLQDWNVKPDHMVPWIDALRERGVTVKMMLGQWGHDYPHRDDFNATLEAWLGHYLKGIDTGILDVPLVQVQDTDDVWRDEERWPPARAAPLVLYPSADGSLGAEPGTGTSQYLDAPSAATATFTSAPLERDLRLVGAPTLRATVTSTGPRATLAATLSLDGEIIDQCFLDLGHRDDMAQQSPMVPAQSYDVVVACYPQDTILPGGSVLSIEIGHTSPVGAPVTVVPFATGALVTLAHGEGTALDLPVVIFEEVAIEEPQPVDIGCWAC